jgi:hypothetical protein
LSKYITLEVVVVTAVVAGFPLLDDIVRDHDGRAAGPARSSV